MRASSSSTRSRSNWTWDEKAGQYFWHRFYSTQPDLNLITRPSRKDAQCRQIWLDMGIDGFRADAVPYLFEREGTNCENLPETHEYLKKVRAYMDEHYPGASCCARPTSGPKTCAPILATATNSIWVFTSRSCRASLCPCGWGSATRWCGSSTARPEIPDDCQWCTFLRNHDELTLEMVTEEERQWMWHEYAPEERMRLNLGIRRRLAPLLDNDRRKIELANSLLVHHARRAHHLLRRRDRHGR
jgi:maltose alpha-D-glucosyltransferase / alpha-amylase